MADQLIDLLTRAACEGFWEGHDRPRAWNLHSSPSPEVFRLCAAAALQAGQSARRRTGAAATIDELAEAVCDAFFLASEMPQRWPAVSAGQAATFRAMADKIQNAGRAARASRPAPTVSVEDLRRSAWAFASHINMGRSGHHLTSSCAAYPGVLYCRGWNRVKGRKEHYAVLQIPNADGDPIEIPTRDLAAAARAIGDHLARLRHQPAISAEGAGR